LILAYQLEQAFSKDHILYLYLNQIYLGYGAYGVEAKELGFSKISVSNISEIIEFFKLEDYEIININENWSEKFVRLISSIAPILMMIGLACIYIEMQAPGFGIFGLIGITCLSLVFLA
jgi:Membrane carboxypeptidase/penicillin-binding protein